MIETAADIARRLGENAEAVCRRYLSKGRREGNYWMVGNIHNERGRSLYVRLSCHADCTRSSGKWTDAESGEHGDLLDIIATSCGHSTFRETLEEARHFLSLAALPEAPRNPSPRKASTGTPEAARRLWAASKPMADSLGRAYLARRSILCSAPSDPLRFHANCFYRPSRDDTPDGRAAWPAMIAAVTDLTGTITGIHRTWLDPETRDKAPVAYPRRAMGHLLGHGVRFGVPGPVMIAGEGIETLLSLREILPTLPMIAGLSAAHLAAIMFPEQLKRLYVARDDDLAGAVALAALRERAADSGLEIRPLEPRHGDFNSDLMALGRSAMSASLWSQLVACDRLMHL